MPIRIEHNFLIIQLIISEQRGTYRSTSSRTQRKRKWWIVPNWKKGVTARVQVFCNNVCLLVDGDREEMKENFARLLFLHALFT